jgi:hypothetical protein
MAVGLQLGINVANAIPAGFSWTLITCHGSYGVTGHHRVGQSDSTDQPRATREASF